MSHEDTAAAFLLGMALDADLRLPGLDDFLRVLGEEVLSSAMGPGVIQPGPSLLELPQRFSRVRLKHQSQESESEAHHLRALV